MKYAIINIETIQKRIDDLETWSKHNEKVGEYDSEGAIISELRQLISESTPLIPEIEKAFDEGKAVGIISYLPSHSLNKELYNERKEHYINNLKLDI